MSDTICLVLTTDLWVGMETSEAGGTKKNAYAFLLGCDIDGWTNGTTIEEQKSWAQSVQNLIKTGIDEILKPYKQINNISSRVILPTGDGAFVAFVDSALVDAPLKLAAFLTTNAENLPCTLGLALHSGVVSFVEDSAGHPNLSGDGISDLSRILEASSNWRISISSRYADILENLDRETRHLFSATPVVREDKHGKKHYIKFIHGRYDAVELGRLRGADSADVMRQRAKVNLSSLSELPSWLTPERRQEILRLYEIYITGGRLKEARSLHLRKLTSAPRKSFLSPQSPAWTSLATTDSLSGYRLALGLQNRGCSYRRNDPLKVGCFHCGFYAGSRPPPKVRETSSLQMQFYKALQYGFERGIKFDVIEFLSDGSFLDDDEVPERTKNELFSAIRAMPNTRRVLIESVPGKVINQHAEVVERLNCLRDDQELEIGIGFENADDFIRQVTLNKGTQRETFEEAVRHLAALPPELRRRVRPVAYLFVKPPWLSEEETIKDCLHSIEYIHALSCEIGMEIVPKLEPAIVSEGTLLNVLWHDGLYSPLSYWSVVEILARLQSHPTCSDLLQKIRIGTRSDMDDSAKIPAVYRSDGRFDQYDFILYRGVQQFNQHHDLSALFGLLQAVYTARRENILDKEHSLTSWTQSTFTRKSESAILDYISSHQDEIEKAAARPSVAREAKYVGKLFKFLDFVEGHKDAGNKWIEKSQKWWESFHSAASVEVAEAVRNEMEEEIRSMLRTQLSYSEVRLLDIYAEEGEEHLLRARLEVIDLLQKEVYEIWVGIPS